MTAPLHTCGYALLRGAVPAQWVGPLQAAFDAGVRPSNAWPVPRGPDWRHAQVDLDPLVQATCRLPALLACVGALIGERFLLGQVEGREPLPGAGHQGLHRDLSMHRPGDTVSVLVYLDDFDASNGATRLVPGTHGRGADAGLDAAHAELLACTVEGRAGDVLVFDADLLHAAGCNVRGARRRTLLCGYFASGCADALATTAALRAVRMDTRERFDPDGRPVTGG